VIMCMYCPEWCATEGGMKIHVRVAHEAGIENRADLDEWGARLAFVRFDE
jgi:hypothetical protein